MDLLIIILTIAFAIYKDKKKKEKKAKTVAGMNQSAKERQKKMEKEAQKQREMQKKAEKKRQQEAFEADRRRQQQQMQSAKNKFDEINRQRELKNRLEKKYRPPVQQESILERAVGNVAEERQDELKSIHMVGQHDTANASNTGCVDTIVAEDGTERMKKVYDLMVTGYEPNLHFERDFIAEGMDMLNRIQA